MSTVEILPAIPQPLDLPKAGIVSLVIPCHNESESLSALYVRAAAVMERIANPWEMVCVNDSVSDRQTAFFSLVWPFARLWVPTNFLELDHPRKSS